ncbi:methionine aminopeptidase, type I [Leptospira fainei serovar Hurstbridge str. BUT 6]|uniref:Methionine aminopeptidase n=1 Tax=Leptospira fainei serovar Hurstbridge str. BUT 6 TaxID=1193011 RepID=S3V8M3_9LEPT|nr:type I methionyl aminopeptidase [Leptospira fainei]EPG72780.1 methionine aminopeptidase, type I [Leptospira fainei serovar Hurstbridge str. BUT 6]
MSIESEKDIIGLQKVGNLVAETIKLMIANASPGITTKSLDKIARNYFESFGAHSAPEITYNFPGATCISVNHEVAHGIPGSRVLREGDLLNVDVSLELEGYFADAGYSICLSPARQNLINLCNTSHDILLKTIKSLRSGNKINKIGCTIETEAKKHGYQVIRNLTGHGTGRRLHEEPDNIVNYKDPTDLRLLSKGMVIAVETFISTGAKLAIESNDGWTLTTPDKSYVAQFEHTIIVTEQEPVLLTV